MQAGVQLVNTVETGRDYVALVEDGRLHSTE